MKPNEYYVLTFYFVNGGSITYPCINLEEVEANYQNAKNVFNKRIDHVELKVDEFKETHNE